MPSKRLPGHWSASLPTHLPMVTLATTSSLSCHRLACGFSGGLVIIPVVIHRGSPWVSNFGCFLVLQPTRQSWLHQSNWHQKRWKSFGNNMLLTSLDTLLFGDMHPSQYKLVCDYTFPFALWTYFSVVSLFQEWFFNWEICLILHIIIQKNAWCRG